MGYHHGLTVALREDDKSGLWVKLKVEKNTRYER